MEDMGATSNNSKVNLDLLLDLLADLVEAKAKTVAEAAEIIRTYAVKAK